MWITPRILPLECIRRVTCHEPSLNVPSGLTPDGAAYCYSITFSEHVSLCLANGAARNQDVLVACYQLIWR